MSIPLDIFALPYDLVVGLVRFQPFYSRGYNGFDYLIQFTKLVSDILLLIFVDRLHVHVRLYFQDSIIHNISMFYFQPVTTTVVGFVLLVINSLVALILVVLLVLKLGMRVLLAVEELKYY